jgi:hypothetical protein
VGVAAVPLAPNPPSHLPLQADYESVSEHLTAVLADPACWTSRFDVLRSILEYHPSTAAGQDTATGGDLRHQPTESVDVVIGLVKVVLDRWGGGGHVGVCVLCVCGTHRALRVHAPPMWGAFKPNLAHA